MPSPPHLQKLRGGDEVGQRDTISGCDDDQVKLELLHQRHGLEEPQCKEDRGKKEGHTEDGNNGDLDIGEGAAEVGCLAGGRRHARYG
jgi:hypothetical protein